MPEVEAKPGVSPRSGFAPPVEHQFKPGQSGNPGGSRTAGGWLKEHVNAMATASKAELMRILSDEDAPVAKRAAARLWIDAASNMANAAGSPIAGPELDRIWDRTEGKPKQAVDLAVTKGDPVEVITPLTGGATDAQDTDR